MTFPDGDGSPAILYTPEAEYAGPDWFTYYAVDDIGRSSAETVTLDVVGDVNDAPSCWHTGALITRPGRTVTAAITCYDPDGDPLTFAIAEGGAPEHGTFELSENGTNTWVAAVHRRGVLHRRGGDPLRRQRRRGARARRRR